MSPGSNHIVLFDGPSTDDGGSEYPNLLFQNLLLYFFRQICVPSITSTRSIDNFNCRRTASMTEIDDCWVHKIWQQAASSKGRMRLALLSSLATTALGASVGGFYPENHFEYVTEIQSEEHLNLFVQSQLDQKKSVFVRWIASEG